MNQFKNMEIQEPYYVVNFNAKACLFELFLNNVPLFRLDVQGMTGTEFPMNNLILSSGKQQLSVKVMPCLGETTFRKGSAFSTKIVLFDVVDGFKLIKEEQEHEMPSMSENMPPIYAYTTVFEANVPYRLQAWQNSKDLSEIESLKSLILEEYDRIKYIVENKIYDALKAIVAQREQNAAISMYLSEEQSARRINKLIYNLENGFRLVPLSGSEVLHLYADGKLAALRTMDGNIALWFEHTESKERFSLDLFFHLPDDKLKVI
jgi:hypothetical protein